jgi:hypothetical protein
MVLDSLRETLLRTSRSTAQSEEEVLKSLFKLHGLDLTKLDGEWCPCDDATQEPQPIAAIEYRCGRYVEYYLLQGDGTKLIQARWRQVTLGRWQLIVCIDNLLARVVWPACDAEDARKRHVVTRASYRTLDLQPAKPPKSLVSFKRLVVQ